MQEQFPVMYKATAGSQHAKLLACCRRWAFRFAGGRTKVQGNAGAIAGVRRARWSPAVVLSIVAINTRQRVQAIDLCVLPDGLHL